MNNDIYKQKLIREIINFLHEGDISKLDYRYSFGYTIFHVCKNKFYCVQDCRHAKRTKKNIDARTRILFGFYLENFDINTLERWMFHVI